MEEPGFLILWLPRATPEELYAAPGIGVGSEGFNVATPSWDLRICHGTSGDPHHREIPGSL